MATMISEKNVGKREAAIFWQTTTNFRQQK